MKKNCKKPLLNYIERLEKALDDMSNKMNASENEIFERMINKMSCKQACPFNTLSGCKKDELNEGVCISDEMKKSEWISVKDRLPKSMEEVLICNDRGYVVVGRLEDNGEWLVTWSLSGIYHVTHWRPLPEPPKEVER